GYATHNLFDLLGVTPVIGRTMRAEDDHPGAARVVLLTNGYWKNHFAADPGIIGQTLPLDGERYQVIGVLPPLVGLGRRQVWLPLGLFTAGPSYNRGNHPGLMGVARLKPGVTLAQMRADLSRVSRE